MKLTEEDRKLDLTEYTCPLGPHLTHGKCAKIVVAKIWKYLPDWNQDFFFLEIRNQTQKKNRKILKEMEIKHPFTQSISKQKSQKKLKHLETNDNKEKFVKLEDTWLLSSLIIILGKYLPLGYRVYIEYSLNLSGKRFKK